jgi:hypothetical protein
MAHGGAGRRGRAAEGAGVSEDPLKAAVADFIEALHAEVTGLAAKQATSVTMSIPTTAFLLKCARFGLAAVAPLASAKDVGRAVAPDPAPARPLGDMRIQPRRPTPPPALRGPRGANAFRSVRWSRGAVPDRGVEYVSIYISHSLLIDLEWDDTMAVRVQTERQAPWKGMVSLEKCPRGEGIAIGKVGGRARHDGSYTGVVKVRLKDFPIADLCPRGTKPTLAHHGVQDDVLFFVIEPRA